MYDIKLKVNADGTLETGKAGRLHLGTELECRRARFVVEVDASVEGSYRYIRLYHPRSNILLRLTSLCILGCGFSRSSPRTRRKRRRR